MKRFAFIVCCLLPAALRSQCAGSFLFYNHDGRFGGQFDCWTCGNDFLPVVAIREPVQNRMAFMRFAAKDTAGNRLFGIPQNPGYMGYPAGTIYQNNTLWWGNLAAWYMGQTSSTWYYGIQRFVFVLPCRYYTSCTYAGDVWLHVEAKTYIPLVGDTCYYDTIVVVPPCYILGFVEHQPEPVPIPEPEVVDAWNLDNFSPGLRALLLWDGDRYSTKKQITIK